LCDHGVKADSSSSKYLFTALQTKQYKMQRQ